MPAAPDAATQPLVLADRTDADTAIALIADFGVDADGEAKRRAVDSRDIGNVLHFCRWRRIGRLIALLTGGDAAATRH